jgi:hypothetical protein
MSLFPQTRQRRASSILAAAVLFAIAPARGAAVQEPTTPCERYSTHDVILLGAAGEPVSQWTASAPAAEPAPVTVTPLNVERAFRGSNASVILLRLDPQRQSLDAGRRYLVYGMHQSPENLELITPALVIPAEEATADLELLETAVSSPSGGTIQGTLLAGRTDDSSSRTPLSGVSVRISGRGVTAEATTNANGRFVVNGIPAGAVRIEPLLPDDQIAEVSADLEAGGCTAVEIVAER